MHRYQRSEYNFEEKRAIIQYIMDNNGYGALRGNIFWQEMADKKILNRSWQSMKEHFKKKLIDELHLFKIPEEEKQLFRNGWSCTARYDGPKKSRNVAHRRNLRTRSNDTENYEISDDSDTDTRRKKANRRRSPSEFNKFSDEEDETNSTTRKQTNNVNSNQDPIDLSTEDDSRSTPDLLDSNEAALNKFQAEQNRTCSKQNKQIKNKEPDESIDLSSDSDEVTIVSADIPRSDINNEENKVEFSLEDDQQLINFMRLDATYLASRDELRIYEHYNDLYSTNKTAKQLMKRFIVHIFPNIHKYNFLSHEQMCNFYKDAGVDIPENLKELTENSLGSDASIVIYPKKKPTGKIKLNNNSNNNPTKATEPNDAEASVCEHLLNKNFVNCFYCPMMLQGENHIFISAISQGESKENILKLISKKFCISQENIHFVDFELYSLLEQVNKFRNAMIDQFGNVVSKYLDSKTDEKINLKDVISTLEICLQAFSKEDEDSGSENDEETSSTESGLNTVGFKPQEKSTPQRDLPIKEENVTAISDNMQDYVYDFADYSIHHLNDHNYTVSVPEIEIKTENCDYAEDNENIVEDNSQDSNVKNSLDDTNKLELENYPSQNLESVPSEEIENMQIAIPNMLDDTTDEEIFFTAPSSSAFIP